MLAEARSVADREDAAERLGQLGDAAAGPALLGILDGDEHWLRVKAIVALGAIGYRDAAAALADIAGDDRWECWHTRTEAIDALALLGATEAADVLIDVVRADGDPDIRICAARALGVLRIERAVVALRMTAARTDVAELAACSREAIEAIEGAG